MKPTFTLSFRTLDRINVLGRVHSIFFRRHIAIEEISVVKNPLQPYYTYTLSITENETNIAKIIGQLSKQIDITDVRYYPTNDSFYEEIILCKVKKTREVQTLIGEHNAHIVNSKSDFIIIKKIGKTEEIYNFLKALIPHELLDFTLSGKISILL